MVEYALNLDLIFNSLADPTRRDILARVSKKQLSIKDIAKHYKLTFAAISKHLKVLENAKLIIKQRKGKEQLVMLSPKAVSAAEGCLRQYEKLWNDRFDRLEILLEQEKLKFKK